MQKNKTTKKKVTRKKKNKVSYSKKKLQEQKHKRKRLIIFTISIISLFIIVSSLIIYFITVNDKLQKAKSELVDYEEKLNNMESISHHYVFLGDSITEQYDLEKYFNGYYVINSGVSGNTTEHILNDLDDRVYKYNPSTVFIMIGTNDINENETVEHVFENIKKIISEIQKNLPKTQIVLQAITPTQNKWTEYDDNEKRKRINNLLIKEYEDSNVKYIDLYEILKDKNTDEIQNRYTEDGLHLNDEAYKVISKELKKYMNKINNEK